MSNSSFASILKDNIPELGYYEDLYKHFHRNPEISTLEVETSKRIASELKQLNEKHGSPIEIKTEIGKTGLIAISVAQWAFAFGGMIAFCIIVGDTIPHVIQALIPGLQDIPFLWLLTDRRAVIVLFVLAVSWPLSLYRDIAKVGGSSTIVGLC